MEQKNRTILLIEDSKDIAGAVSAILGAMNMSVSIARNGVEGIETAKRLKPDLIILDIMLPKLSGFEVCKILKSDNATWKIPIVIMSTLSSADDKAKAKQCGADHFITKPYDMDVLISEVTKFLPKK